MTSQPEIRPEERGASSDKPAPAGEPWLAERLHRIVVIALLVVMAAEVVILIWRGPLQNVPIVLAIMAVVLAPVVLRHKLPVQLPLEFQMLVILFVFASLFLGEIHGFYERFWWWDLLLHATSGLLLGILGFGLIYVLNESDRVHVHMRPGFMALFAFCFALALGALWEIFEFGMDQFFGTTMQKPMLDDPSGLTDTMFDLILDALGALVISLYGYWYMKRGQRSFIMAWIERFARNNPHLFPARWRNTRMRGMD